MINAKLFKIIPTSNTFDVEIEGEDIYYCWGEYGKSKEGIAIYGEGIQLNNYKRTEEITKLCREISENLKKLEEVLKSN